jgi:hypothetical protein
VHILLNISDGKYFSAGIIMWDIVMGKIPCYELKNSYGLKNYSLLLAMYTLSLT